MDGEAHTVIAGMRAQQEDGEDAMGGGSYNGGGQDPMIPQTSFVAHSDSIILVIASQCNLWGASRLSSQSTHVEDDSDENLKQNWATSSYDR